MGELDFQTPSAEDFAAHSRGLLDDGRMESGANFHQLNLYVGGGVNRCYFCFTSYEGQLFYPAPIASVGCQKYVTRTENMNSAGVLTYETITAASYYKLRPFEAVFNASNTMNDRPVWSFGVSWLLPHSLRDSATAFSLRDVVRSNKGDATTPTPEVKLWENFLLNGQVATRSFVRKTLTKDEMKSVSFPIY